MLWIIDPGSLCLDITLEAQGEKVTSPFLLFTPCIAPFHSNAEVLVETFESFLLIVLYNRGT